jgi:FkbM family methyltransferase
LNLNELTNRIRRRLGFTTSHWDIDGELYVFKDCRWSLTPVIVYREITNPKGLYKDIRLNPGETVLDIGAHVGMFAIPLARKNPSCKFICYEPNPTNYKNLVHNIEKNNVKNVKAINAGIAPSVCVLDIEHFDFNSGGSRAVAGIKTLIPGEPLSEILKNNSLNHVEVCKIDCEGGEFNYSITPEDCEKIELLIMEVHSHLAKHQDDITQVVECTAKALNRRISIINDKKELQYLS